MQDFQQVHCANRKGPRGPYQQIQIYLASRDICGSQGYLRGCNSRLFSGTGFPQCSRSHIVGMRQQAFQHPNGGGPVSEGPRELTAQAGPVTEDEAQMPSDATRGTTGHWGDRPCEECAAILAKAPVIDTMHALQHQMSMHKFSICHIAGGLLALLLQMF